MTTKFGLGVAAVGASVLLLSGCEAEKESVSYTGVNHTNEEVYRFLINGQGGVMNVEAQGGGGQACCVTIPRHWKPGLKVTIKWQGGGSWLKDEHGREVIRSGRPVLVESPWKERTVEIPKYKPDRIERFDVHFLPNDEIRVIVGRVEYPEHPDYPIPYPHRKEIAE